MQFSRTLLNRHDVAKAVGRSGTTIDIWRLSGKMPPPVVSPRGRILGWLEGDIGPWLLNRAKGVK